MVFNIPETFQDFYEKENSEKNKSELDEIYHKWCSDNPEKVH